MFKAKRYYKVDEVFRSLQGEGTYSGSLVTFVRFHGCNKNCSFCDTPGSINTSGVKGIMEEELIEKILVESGGSGVVVFTGGEPFLQLTKELLFELRSIGFILHAETHGDVKSIVEYRAEREHIYENDIYGLMGLIHWVTVSPKRNPTSQEVMQASRYVRAYKVLFAVGKETIQPMMSNEAIAFLETSGADLFLQPIWPYTGGNKNMATLAGKWIFDHGGLWRLGTQLHKIVWSIR